MKIGKKWLDSHQWFLRTSNNGLSHDGYKRKRVGAWNKAPHWTGKPTCKDCGGFFGIDKEANGFGLPARPTLELCEWRGRRVVIDDKICVSEYRVVAVDDDIPDEAFKRCAIKVYRGRKSYQHNRGCGIVRSGAPRIEQRDGRIYTYGQSQPHIKQRDGWICIYGQSQPHIKQHGGWICIYGQSQPHIKQHGGWICIYSQSQPHIKQRDGRICIYGQSQPHIKQRGGRIDTYDQSQPRIEQHGGGIYTYDQSQPHIKQHGGWICIYGQSVPVIKDMRKERSK